MSRNVYIADKNNVFKRDTLVEDGVAAKMLKVYDKAQKFKPMTVDMYTTVDVGVGVVSCVNKFCSIKLNIGGQLHYYSLEEAKRMIIAFEATVKYVESHKN